MSLQIVVPMAGEGRRFQECGYALPKPLIPVAGVPMVVRAVQDLPAAERVIFLARTEHLEKFPLVEELRRHVPQCEVVAVRELTAGQACTVRLAAERLDRDAPVIVAACDNTHLYDRDSLLAAMVDPAIECLIWTYRNDTRVLANPAHHGWVEVDGRRVVGVSCKVPISASPLGDHAITGCFSFKNAGRMIDYIDRMVAQNVRIRNEFYLDTLPNLMVADGLRAEVFEVEKYIGWGTPADLHDFQAWERYFVQLR
jgi:NDP-sugar pyrophosphorylase family protein